MKPMKLELIWAGIVCRRIGRVALSRPEFLRLLISFFRHVKPLKLSGPSPHLGECRRGLSASRDNPGREFAAQAPFLFSLIFPSYVWLCAGSLGASSP